MDAEAADEIIRLRAECARLREALVELVDVVEGYMEGVGDLDSFTLQPARAALRGDSK